jgi:hypothetical protein
LGKEQVIKVVPKRKAYSAKAKKLEALLNYAWDQEQIRNNPMIFISKAQEAAYKAWIKRYDSKINSSPIDLELSPVERVTREVIKELKCRGYER